MKKLFFVFFLLTNISCNSFNQRDNVPSWVLSQPELCGVGIYKKRIDSDLDKDFSIAKARLDLKKKIFSMIKPYEETGELDKGVFEKKLTESSSSYLAMTFINQSNYTRVAEDKQYIYSLFCVKPETLIDTISQINTLSHDQKKSLTRRVEIAQKELSKYVENY